jgi:hypothetical protein
MSLLLLFRFFFTFEIFFIWIWGCSSGFARSSNFDFKLLAVPAMTLNQTINLKKKAQSQNSKIDERFLQQKKKKKRKNH